MSVDRGAVRRAFSTYRGASVGTRAFVAARYVVAPLGPIAEEFRGRSGRVLSLGSGLCMLERYIAELEPGLHFDGLDLDPAKVELIARTRHLSPRVGLSMGDATRLGRAASQGTGATFRPSENGDTGGGRTDPGDEGGEDSDNRYDVVLICDAMHHFAADQHAEVIRSVTDRLRPGGTLVIKDLDSGPAWKYHWNRVHDRIVAGPDPIHCRPPAEMAAIVTEAGLTVERAERIDHVLTPYAHYLIRATLPTG
ncbi:MAG: class I SAM-dependent methyltransferase [Microthrixaceae bacterium]|nr:class I SAM-dependent methyltransferase [Acidimicrobiales bacterium]MCB9404423.1 class I SAM-dependent methyltransferase [Microthrixaceae bacterium]